MDAIYEVKEYTLKFYAKYSRYIDFGAKFILALFTFATLSNNIGFMKVLANPAITIGLSLICALLPIVFTTLLAALVVLIQFFTLVPGVAIVSGAIFFVMFALYFRFSPGKSVVLLLTPLAFVMNIPMIVPIVGGLLGGPVCAIPIAFGTVVYFMISHVTSYETLLGTVAKSGVMSQITTFTQQLFSNKEMSMLIVSFTICLLAVYCIRRLSVDYAWEIAIVGGGLLHIIMMTFGHIIMDINVSYLELISASIVSMILAYILRLFVFSVDYNRAEYLQFEDDEYYYYVKAVPKVFVAATQKTVKKINARQNDEEIVGFDEIEQGLEEMKTALEKEARNQTKQEMDESEIQKIIEEELSK